MAISRTIGSRTKTSRQRWLVLLPATGHVEVEVEAESEHEAIQAALEADDFGEVLEWQVHEIVAEGNVCHAALNEAEAYPTNES